MRRQKEGTLPGCEGDCLVGFGVHRNSTFKELYEAKDRERKSYVDFLRNKDTKAGSKMDALKKYILQRDQKIIRAEHRKKPSSASSAPSASQPVPHPSRLASPPSTQSSHSQPATAHEPTDADLLASAMEVEPQVLPPPPPSTPIHSPRLEQRAAHRLVSPATEGGRAVLTDSLQMWWYPPQPRLLYHQPPASPDVFFIWALCLWMAYRMWSYKLICSSPNCRRSGQRLTACGLYKTVRRYLECQRCHKKLAAWSYDILDQLDPAHRTMFPALKCYCCEFHTKGVKLYQLPTRPITPPPPMPPVPTAQWLLSVHAEDVQSRHPLYGLFMAKLSACIFIWDEGNAALLKEAKMRELELQHGIKGLTDEQLTNKLTAKQLALHCRCCTRGKEETEQLIEQLLEAFKDGRETMGIPLVDQERMSVIWDTQRHHLSCIQDPPGVQLYTQTGSVTKGGLTLPVYRCARGSTSLESFHNHLNCFIPGTSTNLEIFQAYLLEGLEWWNEDCATAAVTHDAPLSLCCYSGSLQHSLNELSYTQVCVCNAMFCFCFFFNAQTSVLQPYFLFNFLLSGELIGVEYLCSQQSWEFRENFGQDPDAPDGIPADLGDIEDEGFGDEAEEQDHTISPLFQPRKLYACLVIHRHPLIPPRACHLSCRKMYVCRTPDGTPGFDRVVDLARYLVEEAADIVRLWDRLPDTDSVSYPLRHKERLLQGRFKATHSKTSTCHGKESLKRCVLGQGSGPAQKKLEADVLVLSVPLPQISMVSKTQLPVAKQMTSMPSAPGSSLQPFPFIENPDLSGQAPQRGQRRPPPASASTVSAPPAAALSAPPTAALSAPPAASLPAPPTAALSAPLAAALSASSAVGTSLSRTTPWRKRKAQEALAQEQGLPRPQQPRKKEFGHTRVGSFYFCSTAEGKTLEEWLQEKRKGP
ncbi:hypothetical protein Q8A67_010360 [Cirrhinus molitorella]|uniref:DUF6729 domain-containing protein n=1 Tax=Cirrhinus molitorella TaxID=172907 RepID=A0AA88PWH0_9TELE|nr:hypothetical protein Q8A67_010360 [Cirrhinus molitorella]